MRRFGVVLVAMVLVGSGCSLDSSSEPEPAEAWRQATITPIGQPVATGDTVVVYGTVGTDLHLYGVAIGDGTIRWRQPATPSLTLSGIPLTPAVIDDRIAYFRPHPADNLLARLVVAAPDTGADVLVSDPTHFRSHPRHCADDKDICVSVDDGRSLTSWRFSVEAGGLVRDHTALPRDSRLVGEALLDLGPREPELLAGLKDGAVRWTSALTHHFPPGFSTDFGWDFDLYRSAGLYVGSVGRPADRDDAVATAVDLGRSQTAAIRADTGSSAWRAEGTDLACGAKIVLQRRVGGDRWEPWPVRCRYKGWLHYDKAANATRYESLVVTVEGFDVPTGRTTWSVPLRSAEAFMQEGAKATAVNDEEILIHGPSDPVIIDVSDGSTRVPKAGTVFWCSKGVFFTYREPRRLRSGGTSDDWRGGTILHRCAADGSPTTATPRDLAPSLGATVGDRTVVAEAGGLVAFDRR